MNKITALILCLAVLPACSTKRKAQALADQAREAVDQLKMQELDPKAAEVKFNYRVSEPIFFDFNSVELDDQARRIIQNKYFIDKPRRITLEGHCDKRGTDAYNLVLGERRALAVKEYFVFLGMDEDSITTISYGKEKPYCEWIGPEAEEAEETCYKVNRRVDMEEK